VPPPRDLDDEADDAGRIVFSEDDDDVPDLAEPVAGGVEDGAPDQARDENPLRTHPSSVVRAHDLASSSRPGRRRRGMRGWMA
jgi:hypothetical protein